MSESWGHSLERLSDQRLAELAADDQRRLARGSGYDYGRCTMGRIATHTDRATYVASYNYVTGGAGRVSWASKLVCDEHAAKFAAKHGIDLASVPTQRERPKHTSELMVEQFFGGDGRA
jgi:hypothetical protein